MRGAFLDEAPHGPTSKRLAMRAHLPCYLQFIGNCISMHTQLSPCNPICAIIFLVPNNDGVNLSEELKRSVEEAHKVFANTIDPLLQRQFASDGLGMPGSPLKLAAPVQPTLRRLSPFDNFRFGRHQSF